MSKLAPCSCITSLVGESDLLISVDSSVGRGADPQVVGSKSPVVPIVFRGCILEQDA